MRCRPGYICGVPVQSIDRNDVMCHADVDGGGKEGRAHVFHTLVEQRCWQGAQTESQHLFYTRFLCISLVCRMWINAKCTAGPLRQNERLPAPRLRRGAWTRSRPWGCSHSQRGEILILALQYIPVRIARGPHCLEQHRSSAGKQDFVFGSSPVFSCP